MAKHIKQNILLWASIGMEKSGCETDKLTKTNCNTVCGILVGQNSNDKLQIKFVIAMTSIRVANVSSEQVENIMNWLLYQFCSTKQ